jgi:hypothetical protein
MAWRFDAAEVHRRLATAGSNTSPNEVVLEQNWRRRGKVVGEWALTYMWKVFLAIAALHSLPGNARAHLWSSVPQTGNIKDATHRTAFATVQTKSVADEPAATLCNVNTGIAIGLDAGTCASPAAACDGVTDDRLAFVSFNRWAKATRANATGQLIEMQVSGVCKFISGNVNSRLIFRGIKNIRVDRI